MKTMGKQSKDKDKTTRQEQGPRVSASSESRTTSLPNNGPQLAINQFFISNISTTPPFIQALYCGTGCTHGAKAANLGSIAYLSTFCKHFESEGMQYIDRVHKKMIDAMKKDGLKNVPMDTTKALLALGTNLLLSGHEVALDTTAAIAKLVAVFESCDLSLDLAEVAHAVNVQNYTVHSVETKLSFYAKRIPCHCLDGLVANISAGMKNGIGYCVNCDKAYPSTALYNCGQCRRVQYCSKTCQRKHWPKHKHYCNFVDQMKKILQQTATTP
jgi:hypothetical protein